MGSGDEDTQLRAGFCLIDAEQVSADHPGQQPRSLALADPHCQQLAAGPVRVRCPRDLPLRTPVYRFEVFRREDSDRPGSIAGTVLQPRDPVRPPTKSPPVPGPGARPALAARRSTLPMPGPPGYRTRRSPSEATHPPCSFQNLDPVRAARLLADAERSARSITGEHWKAWALSEVAEYWRPLTPTVPSA